MVKKVITSKYDRSTETVSSRTTTFNTYYLFNVIPIWRMTVVKGGVPFTEGERLDRQTFQEEIRVRQQS